MIYKTLHKNLKIEQHKFHNRQGENSKMGDNLYQSNIFKYIIQSLVRKNIEVFKRINIELG